ncbi:50S ribosomal protein L30 [Candidatus Woesearchaeota archaeon B3_Woes]|nr:MAG: 50S ribosomal protein L30 [Candidatus Woesearchaeota archaeon B3_Woes]
MSEESKPNVKYAVIRIRGLVRVKKEINHTMELMGLYRKNYCVLIDKKDFGMIKKVKDYVTYGEIDKETEDLVVKKRGEKTKNKEGKEVIKKFFRLNPPRKGFGRKGIKVAFSKSGGLGYRGDKINDLLKRMLG